MATPSQNAWHTAGRPNRNSQSASRTPQNRSGTASPALPQQQQPPPKDSNRQQPPSNVWTQRSSAVHPAAVSGGSGNGSTSGPNGPPQAPLPRSEPAPHPDDHHVPANGFNAAEILAFACRDAIPAAYTPQGPSNNARSGGSGSSGGSAWGSKPGTMSTGQPFFAQLAKQVAAFEGGG